ncbi:hypothetical protein NZA98_39135, partial [Escherichia coli]|nr:hypothetical protein [Escherichia coli]
DAGAEIEPLFRVLVHLSSPFIEAERVDPKSYVANAPDQFLLVYDACRGKLRSIVLDEATFIELQLLAVLVLC